MVVARRVSLEKRVDRFRVVSGALGPVPPCELAIKPLTVFVGRQGTGKSLVAQVLYFFEELPYLVSLIDASGGETVGTETEVVRSILDQLRSHERRFAAFANPKVNISYERGFGLHTAGSQHEAKFESKFSFSGYRVNRIINSSKSLRDYVRTVRAAKTPPQRRAVFFPTERLVIAQLRSAIAAKVLSLPVTYTLFADWMELAWQTVGEWESGPPSPEAEYVAARGEEALGGHVVRRGDLWRWRYGTGAGELFELDMASSGQRANWSLFYLAMALFELRAHRDVLNNLTVYVEEPEIHLHPAAQVVVTEMLAFLVRQGFRVVITTHSLNVIYALNNLTQASRLGEETVDGTPAPGIRLDPQEVAVYAFGPDKVRTISDPVTGFIDERELGSVSEDLVGQLNTIGANLPAVKG